MKTDRISGPPGPIPLGRAWTESGDKRWPHGQGWDSPALDPDDFTDLTAGLAFLFRQLIKPGRGRSMLAFQSTDIFIAVLIADPYQIFIFVHGRHPQKL